MKADLRKINIRDLRKILYKNVSKTLAVSNRRPTREITDALLSWDRAYEHYDDMVSSLGTLKGKKLLEVGSGYGLFLAICLSNGIKARGVEPAENNSYKQTNLIAGEILKRTGFDKSVIVEGAGEKIPFGDNTFDAVVSFYTLEHVNNLNKVFYESKRVLKKGGYIFFVVPNYGSFWEGHYGIVWIPYISKFLARFYVRLWNKTPELLDELQLVNQFKLESICKKLKLKLIDWGGNAFEKKLYDSQFTSVGTLSSALKIIEFFKKYKILKAGLTAAKLLRAQTPIMLTAQKK